MDGLTKRKTAYAVGECASRFVTINTVLRKLAGTGVNTAIVRLSDLATDDTTHFTGDALVTAGERYASALRFQLGVA